MTIKIGGACQWLDRDYNRVDEMNMRTSTVKYLSQLTPRERHLYLLAIVKHNMKALRSVLNTLARAPEHLRMWRISSELLPVATHAVTAKFYQEPDVQSLLAHSLAKCGDIARDHGIRLSFHPAQYVVLGSRNHNVARNAIYELSYHARCFELMGYTKDHERGCAINVHVGPKEADVQNMRAIISDNPNVSKFLTLENDEFSWDLKPLVETFGDLVPVVMDIHHYWIANGKHIQSDDPLIKHVRRSWKGGQPKLHHATSKHELCEHYHRRLKRPMNLDLLLIDYTKSALRAHSDHPWHTWSNEYAASFGFDIMWEGKDKNRGASAIAHQLKLK